MSPIRTAAEILRDIESSGVPDDGSELTEAPADRQIGSRRVASMLGVSQDTVRNWAKANRLPCIKTGGHLKFWESDVHLVAHRLRTSRPLPPVGSGTAAPAAGER